MFIRGFSVVFLVSWATLQAHLPRMWVDLVKLDLMRGDGFTITIEDQKPGASCPLIDRPNEHLGGLHDFSNKRAWTRRS